jgi:primosomal protein N' (replication factor Y)
VQGRFHYSVPDHLFGALQVGHRVLVPFGRRRATAFVVGLATTIPDDVKDKLRPISERLDPDPLLPSDVLQLATFCADYYLSSVGEVLRVALPPGITGASKARWTITAQGRHWMESGSDVLPDGRRISTAERRLLEASVKGGTKLKDAPVKAAAALEALGLIAKKVSLGARRAGGEVVMVERAIDAARAEVLLAHAPARKELFDLLEAGPRSIDELKAQMGSRALDALKALEKCGAVSRRRVATQTHVADMEVQRSAPLEAASEVPPQLMPEQDAALRAIVERMDARQGGGFLLQGVTGSGKTEVYLRAIAHALEARRGAIVLVPEIALTPQLEARFRARFGDRVAVLHSALADADRRERWRRIHRGEAMIALGPRSAVWAPVRNLGVIVVDEEHDPSFKQNADVRYNGRDLALVRAQRAQAVAVLGSATPSLEAFHLIEQKRLQLCRLRSRVEGRPMPTVEIVDLAEERRSMRGQIRILSRKLEDELRRVIGKKEQAILFLNRRGFNTVVYCEDCSTARRCPDCDVSLTYHKASHKLVCHYCGHVEPLETPCRNCKSLAMQPFGAGTERVVEAVKEAAPDARVLRLDRDITQRTGELDRTLDLFRRGEGDVLVGTQMVAKGHDFARVTLVGIVLADASLAFPDFRAAERTFQLVTQVAGRAGRASNPGHVVIQALQGSHYALTCAIEHDADRFLEIEGAQRREAHYPPHTRMGIIRIESRDKTALDRAARELLRSLKRHASETERIRGPVPAPIGRIRERYRQMLMILAPTPARLVAVMSRVRGDMSAVPRSVDLIFDVDPIDLL